MSYFFLFIISLFYLIYFIVNQHEINLIAYNSCLVFVKNLIPSIMPMYIIMNILINNKIFQRINTYFSYLFPVFDSNKSITLFISGIFLGNPTNVINILNSYQKKEITYEDSLNLIKSSSFVNPLFIYSICVLGNFQKYFIFFFISNIISNYLILLFNKRKKLNVFKKTDNINIIEIISKSSSILLNIFGIFVFMNIIKAPLMKINHSIIFRFLVDTIELSSGLFNLLNYSVSLNLKLYLILVLISFNGVTIIFQSFLYIKKMPIPRHFLLSFFKARIIQLLLNTLLFIVFIF